MLKLDEPFRNQEIFIISLFSKVQIWVLRVLQFLVDILPLGIGSVDPHIFADPDPKHWINASTKYIYCDFLYTRLNEFSS